MKLVWRKIWKFLKGLYYALSRKKRVVGEYCEVDYSKSPNYKGFSGHVRDLCDQNYEGVESLVFTLKREDLTFIFTEDLEYPATTIGYEIKLDMDYHGSVDDDGSIIHEMTHALMACQRYDDSNMWLIEGIADYVRDRLGFSTTLLSTLREERRFKRIHDDRSLLGMDGKSSFRHRPGTLQIVSLGYL